MIDIKTYENKFVMTPIGKGELTREMDFTKRPVKLGVKILKQDCTIPTQSKFRYAFYTAEELESING